jgi:hypothetical protein
LNPRAQALDIWLARAARNRLLLRAGAPGGEQQRTG